MNKNDLVGQVAQDTGLSKVDAARAVDSVFDNIAGSLRNKGEVRLVGFGTFSVSHRKATTGRNPRTGETIQISASNQLISTGVLTGAALLRCPGRCGRHRSDQA